MVDIIKKGLLTAIGTASIAAKNADKILKNVAKKGLISTKDARGLVKKLVKEAERERKRVNRIISEEFKRQLNKGKPVVNKGKRAVKKAVSNARKKVKKAQRNAEKRGRKIVKRAARRLR